MILSKSAVRGRGNCCVLNKERATTVSRVSMLWGSLLSLLLWFILSGQSPPSQERTEKGVDESVSSPSSSGTSTKKTKQPLSREEEKGLLLPGCISATYLLLWICLVMLVVPLGNVLSDLKLLLPMFVLYPGLLVYVCCRFQADVLLALSSSRVPSHLLCCFVYCHCVLSLHGMFIRCQATKSGQGWLPLVLIVVVLLAASGLNHIWNCVPCLSLSPACANMFSRGLHYLRMESGITKWSFYRLALDITYLTCWLCTSWRLCSKSWKIFLFVFLLLLSGWKCSGGRRPQG